MTLKKYRWHLINHAFLYSCSLSSPHTLTLSCVTSLTNGALASVMQTEAQPAQGSLSFRMLPPQCQSLHVQIKRLATTGRNTGVGGAGGGAGRDELPAHAVLPPQLMHQTYKWCPLGLPAPVKPPDGDRNMNDLWRNQQKNCQWPSPNCTTVSK